MRVSRRSVLGAAGAMASPAVAGPGAMPDAAWFQAVLERYAGFGVKASGGPGDEACRAWLEGELSGYGFVCARQAFEAPFFESAETSLGVGDRRVAVIPQAVVATTGAQGLSAPLRRAELGGDLAGAIALIDLPSKRWVALADPQVQRPLADAFARGAAAAVLVTNGPTGEAVALNVSLRKAGFDRPVALLAPKDAQPFLAAAAEGRPARLVVAGRAGRRNAHNLIARIDRGAARTVVVSTPGSGWFTCAAERGSGLAVWLALARWLAGAKAPVNFEFLCTSGHEYEYLGGEAYLHAGGAPAPERTRLWLHIGASAAARDWHELGALRPLPSADPQRVLTATADILERVRTSFAGLAGLEAVYLADKRSAGGELTNVLDAGYTTAIGLYGVHRYFHTQDDDLRCVSGDLVRPVAWAFHRAVAACLP